MRGMILNRMLHHREFEQRDGRVSAECDRYGASWSSLEGGSVRVMLVGKRVASMNVVSDTTSWETCLIL